LVWFGLVWFGLVWFGLVWFGLVWFGLVWFDLFVLMTQEGAMKALTLVTAAALTLLSVASGYAQTGTYYGKGKAPPPPVVTKG
jgi:hypothetical protein